MSRPPCVKCGQSQAVRPGKLCNKCFGEQGKPVARNIERIKLADLRLDDRLQVRVKFRQDVAQDYAEAYQKGEDMPPLTVFRDRAGVNWVADGFHRERGARWANLKDIDCEVRQGEFRDAWLYSRRANEQHGIRRTLEDRRAAVQSLLEDDEYRQESTRAIAVAAGVSFYMADKLRKEIEGKPEPEGDDKLDRDGPSPVDDSPRINAESEAEPEEEPEDDGARSSAPTPRTDATGAVIPERLLDVFGDDALPEASVKVEELCGTLYDGKKLLARLYARAAQLPFCDLEIISTALANARIHLLQAAEALKSGKPHVVCPVCKGRGCKECRQSGYLPKWRHDEYQENGGLHDDGEAA